jgi:hypothetical protein
MKGEVSPKTHDENRAEKETEPIIILKEESQDCYNNHIWVNHDNYSD